MKAYSQYKPKIERQQKGNSVVSTIKKKEDILIRERVVFTDAIAERVDNMSDDDIIGQGVYYKPLSAEESKAIANAKAEKSGRKVKQTRKPRNAEK